MEKLRAFKDEITGRWTLEGVEPSEKTFERICQMLRDNVNFKFARYGDGEFMCMQGYFGCNKDKHDFFPDLGMALNDAFYSNSEYMVGIQPLSVHGGLYQRTIQDKPGPQNLYDADVLHSASIDGRLGEFLEALRWRDTVLVGPGHLMPLNFRTILIPDLNCWKDYQSTREMIGFSLAGKENAVILLCASMMSEVLINDYKDSSHTFIDCGSVFDPLVGKLSRSYHHKLKLNANL